MADWYLVAAPRISMAYWLMAISSGAINRLSTWGVHHITPTFANVHCETFRPPWCNVDTYSYSGVHCKPSRRGHKRLLTIIGTICCLWINGLLSINSSRPSDAYMRQLIRVSLVQIMACRRFGAKPLSPLMMAYHWSDHWEHIAVKFESKLNDFQTRQSIRTSSKCRPFCLCFSMLKCLYIPLNII